MIDTVRSLIDAGKAHAVMGNHELNAIHFHTLDERTKKPLRSHSDRHIRQHKSFLKEFPLGDQKTQEVLDWMQTLPLFREFNGFRVVHACWDEKTIQWLSTLTKGGVLPKELFAFAADKSHELYDLTEITLKGPETTLPDGYTFLDPNGLKRKYVRMQWWNENASTYRDLAISVPNLSQIPDDELPANLRARKYPQSAKPVFFGHYWLTGDPVLQSPNTLCLDYSAGLDGPLVAYLQSENSGSDLKLSNILNFIG